MIEPGFHDLPVELYHQDPCFEAYGVPSLSSSGITTLLTQTPAHFKAKHPRLTEWPDYIEDSTPAQDLGSVVHALVLGKGAEIAIAEYNDWRKSAAQDFRDAARLNGQIPVLRKVYEQAEAIAYKATDKLTHHFGRWPIGEPELAAIWKRRTPSGEKIWCRSLNDMLDLRGGVIVDLKTTGRAIGDDDLAKKLAGDGADIQAAHYLNGLETLIPELAGRATFVFVVVEVDPPFDVRFATLRQRWLHMANMRIDRATDIFAECLATNEWKGWPETAELDPPSWRESQWTNDELSEAV
jgi:hypothetical protein